MDKTKLKRIIGYLVSPRFYASNLIANQKISKFIPDKAYIKLQYYVHYGRKINLSHPTLFNEKLQWIKLNDRKDIYHTMVDKYLAKGFIAEKVGKEYVIPTLGIYNSFDEIDFDALPNKFVLKGTFDSGSYYICTDKTKINKKLAKKKLYVHWNNEFYNISREWPYKGLKKRIIVEPLLEDDTYCYLRDFKFYCFNGRPKIFYITSDKYNNLPVRQDFFDLNGNHLEIEDKHYTNNPITPNLPNNLDKMVELCEKLAKDTYHLRVDFYEINGKIYCGELTFYESSGLCEFSPDKYNTILGNWIKLPTD